MDMFVKIFSYVAIASVVLASCTQEMPQEMALRGDNDLPVDAPATYAASGGTSFVFDEIYFSGDAGLDGSRRVFNDQYFTICNNSSETLYADGLCIGITAGYTYLPSQSVRKHFPKYVIASQVYSIPGSGYDVPVAPGESLVIARSARNHRAESPDPSNFVYNPDLSGADFEIYVPHKYSATRDNPQVPDLIVHHTAFEAFQWLFDGGSPIFLFRVSSPESFVEKNKVTFENPMWTNVAPKRLRYLKGVKVPQSLIIDVVETRLDDKSYPFRTLFAPSVAKSPTFVLPDNRNQVEGGGLQGFFLHRKDVVTSDGRKIKKDSNKSGNDFELILHGQKSYPRK